jgi:hypothetical protein
VPPHPANYYIEIIGKKLSVHACWIATGAKKKKKKKQKKTKTKKKQNKQTKKPHHNQKQIKRKGFISSYWLQSDFQGSERRN